MERLARVVGAAPSRPSPLALTRNLRRSPLPALMITLALAATAGARPPAVAPASPLPLATPESQGMSTERLARLHAELQRFVSEGKYAGLVSLLARNGRIVDWQAYGKRDLEAGLSMEKDTIARIYSMSKIVTSVAALILLEEARFKLDDPIGDYLPELAHMKVMTGGTAEKPLLADAKIPITIKHLFTHTSGLTYGFFDAPVEKLYREAKLDDAASLPEFVERVSRLPLAQEPGERFNYSISTDILGALVEKVSGRPLGEFLEERVLRPLGMKDTGFSLPAAKWTRLAKIYKKGEDGRLQADKPVFGIEPRPGPKLESGGAGLFSTTGDYARFLQMLLNGGQLDGVRILSRKTVELMTTNQVGTKIPWGPGAGFGLAFGTTDRLGADGMASVGSYGWGGAYGSMYKVDPSQHLVMVFMIQQLPNKSQVASRFPTLVYQALVEPNK